MKRQPAASIALGLIALALIVAGGLTWRMTAANCHRVHNGHGVEVCPGVNLNGMRFYPVNLTLRHRAHPLRAELLWGAGGATALAAAVVETRRRRSRGGANVSVGCA